MKKANPTALGLFIVIGLAFGVGAVILFSSESVFHPKVRFILYFGNSLKGLNQGAPVKFRGVNVGRVEQVLIRHNQDKYDFSMPVIVAIDTKLAQSKSDANLEIDDQSRLKELIDHGFRGSLDAESLVTGVLYVGMDFYPNAPAPVYHQINPEYKEVPTVPSAVQQLLDNLQHVDLPGISAKADEVLARLDTDLSQLNVPQINSGLTNLLGSANHFITAPDLTNAVKEARLALEQAQALLARIDGRVDPLVDSATNTLADAQKTLADLRRGLQNLSGLIGPEAYHKRWNNWLTPAAPLPIWLNSFNAIPTP
jgi:paraquat-inducible protein B